MEKKKRIVIALGGNALGNTLPEQMKAVKITSRAIVDLIQEGCEVVVAHGNGPQVGMVNNAMIALTHEDPQQPNTPLSVCVAMSQAYIGYDLRSAERAQGRAPQQGHYRYPGGDHDHPGPRGSRRPGILSSVQAHRPVHDKGAG